MTPLLGWLKKGAGRPLLTAIEGERAELSTQWAQWSQLELVDGVACRRWESHSGSSSQMQLILPPCLVETVLTSLYDSPSGGHLGISKTLAKVREHFYWPQLREDVHQWCRQCTSCSARKSPTIKARVQMVPSLAGNPMQGIAADILGPFPTTRTGNKYILVVSNYFTRWTETYGVNTLVDEWICRFGAPEAIHTDQGRNFEAVLFSEMCQLLGINKTRTTPYHPQSDGLVERLNHTLLTMLSIRTHEDQERWDEYLPECMIWPIEQAGTTQQDSHPSG